LRFELVYRRTLGRLPTAKEKTEGQRFLNSLASETASTSEDQALTALCLAMFNLNEFIYVD
jgi:hypothetical protein